MTAGAGLDIPLTESFSARGEVTYGLGGYSDDIGKIGALSIKAGIVWIFNAGGVNVYRQIEDKNLAIEDHAKILLSPHVNIAIIDSTKTQFSRKGMLDTWVVIPPGTHNLIGFRMSSINSNQFYPERSGRDETGGEAELNYFRSLDTDDNGLQDSWVGVVLLEKGHYYILHFMGDGFAPTLVDITYASSFSNERKKINKTLRIK